MTVSVEITPAPTLYLTEENMKAGWIKEWH